MHRLFIAISLLITVCLPAMIENANAADDSARGQKLYMQHICYTCHGTVGQGAERTGPKLTPNPFPYAAFAAQVRKPRQDMPKYAQQFLSDQDLADIYAYVLSIKPGPAVKDIPLLK